MAGNTYEQYLVEPDAPVLYHAIVRTPIAPMHSEPRIASQMISQQVAGQRVDVLEEEGDWARARGADGYDGWMHIGFLSRVAGDASTNDSTRLSLGALVRTSSGAERSLPLRAVLSPDETPVNGQTVAAAELTARFPLDAQAIGKTAKAYFSGTSYLWGGVTPWGADCSGLVQSVFSLHGLQLPRDAWQQAEMGVDAGKDIDALQAGDLLFFSDRPDRRVTHVGIALGASRMVHLSLVRGGYAVENLRDVNDPFVARLRERFLFARRVL